MLPRAGSHAFQDWMQFTGKYQLLSMFATQITAAENINIFSPADLWVKYKDLINSDILMYSARSSSNSGQNFGSTSNVAVQV